MESATRDVNKLSMPPSSARINEDLKIDGISSTGNEKARGWGSWLGMYPRVGTSIQTAIVSGYCPRYHLGHSITVPGLSNSPNIPASHW